MNAGNSSDFPRTTEQFFSSEATYIVHDTCTLTFSVKRSVGAPSGRHSRPFLDVNTSSPACFDDFPAAFTGYNVEAPNSIRIAHRPIPSKLLKILNANSDPINPQSSLLLDSTGASPSRSSSAPNCEETRRARPKKSHTLRRLLPAAPPAPDDHPATVVAAALRRPTALSAKRRSLPAGSG